MRRTRLQSWRQSQVKSLSFKLLLHIVVKHYYLLKLEASCLNILKDLKSNHWLGSVHSSFHCHTLKLNSTTIIDYQAAILI